MTALVIAEHHGQQLKPVTLTTITAATQLSDTVCVLVAGNQCAKIAESLQNIAGITEILVVENPELSYFSPEAFVDILASLKDIKFVLAPATVFGKNILPRAAAKLNVSPISDVIQIIDHQTFVRPIYAGNALATVESTDPIKMMTVRPTCFELAKTHDKKATIRALNVVISPPKVQLLKEELHVSNRPELLDADIVISGGRGLQNRETFDRLTAIADRMGAAIGASRAAVDAGLAPNDFQVGQTGQVVAPKLYFAIGISGAIQHLAGIKDSKIIVAINKDPEAPIFQSADYGLVADLNDVLTEWEQLLDER